MAEASAVVAEQSRLSAAESRIDIPLALLAKAFAVDWSLRSGEIRRTNCFGCSIQAHSDRSKHAPWCLRGLPALVYALYSQFVTATDHHHVTRLLKRYMIELGVDVARHELLFSKNFRVEVARGHLQHKFQDLVLSYLLNRNPQLLIPCFPGEKPGAHEEVITPLNAR